MRKDNLKSGKRRKKQRKKYLGGERRKRIIQAQKAKDDFMTVCIWQQTDFTDGFPDLGKDITAFYAAVAYL